MERSNERAVKIIEQQYASFINQQDNWGFFRGLAEYVKTIEELTQTRPFLKALEQQREVARKTYELMNTQAMEELTKSANKLLPIAEKVIKQAEPLINQAQELAEKYQPVINAVKEAHDRMAGRILSSNPLYAFSSDLFDVARYLRASGHAEEIKDFEDNERERQNIYGNYTFSQTYEQIHKEEQRVERKEQVEPWGAWEQLPIIKRAVYEPDELIAEYKAKVEEDPSLQWEWLSLIGVVGELRKKCMTAFCESTKKNKLKYYPKCRTTLMQMNTSTSLQI